MCCTISKQRKYCCAWAHSSGLLLGKW
jgi:hypothetical protein